MWQCDCTQTPIYACQHRCAMPHDMFDLHIWPPIAVYPRCGEQSKHALYCAGRQRTVCRITNTKNEIYDDPKDDPLNPQSEYIEVENIPVFDPEKGDLSQRVSRTFLDELGNEEISVEETGYWFTEPPGRRPKYIRCCIAIQPLPCTQPVMQSNDCTNAVCCSGRLHAHLLVRLRPTVQRQPAAVLFLPACLLVDCNCCLAHAGGWESYNRTMKRAIPTEANFANPEHQDKSNRFQLQELQENEVLVGIVTDIWLYHGAQVDLMCEFDG